MEKYPLVIFLHGAGERGTDNEAQIKHIQELFLNPINRKTYPCYVLAPQCPKGIMWARFDKEGKPLAVPSAPMQRTIELLETILRDYPIDVSRIYVTGVSMGGFGTWDIVSRFPDRFAAAIPICGGGNPSGVEALRHLPVWVFHGAKDTVVLPRHSREMVSALKQVGGNPRYTEYAEVAHNSWVNAYRERGLLAWLFQQVNATSPSN